jgi:hypothetical protein
MLAALVCRLKIRERLTKNLLLFSRRGHCLLAQYGFAVATHLRGRKFEAAKWNTAVAPKQCGGGLVLELSRRRVSDYKIPRHAFCKPTFHLFNNEHLPPLWSNFVVLRVRLYDFCLRLIEWYVVVPMRKHYKHTNWHSDLFGRLAH